MKAIFAFLWTNLSIFSAELTHMIDERVRKFNLDE